MRREDKTVKIKDMQGPSAFSPISSF